MFLRVGIYQIQPNFRFFTDYLGKCASIFLCIPYITSSFFNLRFVCVWWQTGNFAPIAPCSFAMIIFPAKCNVVLYIIHSASVHPSYVTNQQCTLSHLYDFNVIVDFVRGGGSTEKFNNDMILMPAYTCLFLDDISMNAFIHNKLQR